MMRSLDPFGMEIPIEDNSDPVLSLNRHFDFSRVDVSALGLPERYLLFNVPAQRCPEGWAREFKAMAASDGYEAVAFPNPQNNPLAGGMRSLFPLSPLAWYKVIQGASGYVGSRFHPVIVSLANQVPFVAVDTYGLSPLCLLGGNFPSKTYDVCRKAGRADQVIKSRFFHLYSPRQIYGKLLRQDPDSRGFAAQAQRVFDGHLDRMCALGRAP